MLFFVTTLLFLAEGSVTTDPLSGGAGWVGAGLLGLVLGWLLLIHLPTKDKQFIAQSEATANLVKDLQNKYNDSQSIAQNKSDALIKSLQDGFSGTLKDIQTGTSQSQKEQRASSKEMLQMVMDHCAKETGHIGEALRYSSDTTCKALEEVSQVVVDLRRTIEDTREAQLLNNIPGPMAKTLNQTPHTEKTP